MLESHFVGLPTPVAGGGSGGVLQSLRDEWQRSERHADFVWYGRHAAFCANDIECDAMSTICPPHPDELSHGVPSNPRNQSACGAPFGGFMPDGYVNEEWFGLLANVPDCN